MKRKYFAPLLSVFLTGAMLITALVAMLSSSFGWFTFNERVNASGLSISSIGIPKTEQFLFIDADGDSAYDEGEEKLDSTNANVFDLMMPGERRTVCLYVRNLSGKSINLTLLMSAPTAESDSVYVESGLYHYLGTQIRLNSIMKSGSDVLALTGTDKYLLPLEDSMYNGGLQPTGISEVYDFSASTNAQLANTITLASDAEATFALEFEFVDNGEVQNAYISFADSNSGDAVKASLALSRTLICYYDFAE